LEEELADIIASDGACRSRKERAIYKEGGKPHHHHHHHTLPDPLSL
jgi:hypothetical protein